MGMDLLGFILAQNWLFGALLSVAGGVVACLGLTMQKASQYRLLKDDVGADSGQIVVLRKPSWPTLLKDRNWWWGVLLFMLHSPLNLIAITYAPETTYTPLSASMVVVNFLFAYGFLHEKFTKKDITATLVCVAASFVMNIAMPRNVPGYMEDFPVETLLEVYMDLFSNVGFAGYVCVWIGLVLLCLQMLTTISLEKVAKPVALPMLVALFESQFHFMAKISTTLLMHGVDHPTVWTDHRFYSCCFLTALFYSLGFFFTLQGCRNLAMRYFVPAIFCSTTCMIVLESLLFFREWQVMTNTDIWIFFISWTVCLISVIFISPVLNVVPPPPMSPRGSMHSPLMRKANNDITDHAAILSIMDEYKIRQPQAKNTKPLEVFELKDYRGTWKVLPILVLISSLAIPFTCFYSGYVFTTFIIVTCFQIYQAWKFGLHIALYSYVGIRKINHYDQANFKLLYEAEKRAREKRRIEGLSDDPPMSWDDVVHFVVFPNYKEDEIILRLAIQSVANSGIATTNIVMVLAMEVREKGSEEKAARLKELFRDKFRLVVDTYHPPDIEGETAGKSSNTKWAARRVMEEGGVIEKEGIDIKNAVFTIADADSDFHKEYFAALTYHFLHGGGPENTTPQRYMTIWQPPILHYKNFITQPALVRIASFLTSEHELANLADPNCTRVPYSTYSISASLAKAVGDWDPDWISEDWHMALKCFLGLRGQLRVIPIFFPVVNYAPEDETYFKTIIARFTQAKRHALGFSELVFFHDYYPKVKASIPDFGDRMIFVWRSFFLWSKLLLIHTLMAIWWIMGPSNGLLIYFLAQNQVTRQLNINSWTFLINCVFQTTSLLSFIASFFMSVQIYNCCAHRIDSPNGKVGELFAADDKKLSIFWRSDLLHFLSVIFQSVAWLPPFFFAAAIAEWIAAAKTAVTHKFKYEVALKPDFSKQT